MSTIFGIFLGAVGVWYIYRYLKSDFANSIKHNSVDKVMPITVEPSEKGKVFADKTSSTTKNSKANMSQVKPDDFKRFDGIGPKISKLLEKQGILTYQQLSEMDDKNLIKFLHEAGVRVRVTDPAYWTKQAKLAAKGKWEDVKKLQQDHKGKRNGNVAKAA